MKRTIALRSALLIGALALSLSWPLAQAAGADDDAAPPVLPATSEPDSKTLERDLQQLSWPQFKAVVEAIPKLKADVDAYGELGWQVVRANYAHYGWKRNIDRLDEAQKRELAGLIEKAKTGR